MKGRAIKYSSDELAWLEANRTLPISDYHHSFCQIFSRSDVSAINLHSLRKRKGWKTGRTGHFIKGEVPHNKGQKCAPGKGGNHPNSRRSQFQKGNLPHNTKYLGHERISKDGYVEISIDETNPHTGYGRRHVLKHRYLWEQKHGPVPEGMALKCLDGNRSNTDPSNWELISRSLLPYLNGHRGLNYETAEPEVRPAVLLVAKVKHARKKANQKACKQPVFIGADNV